MMQLRNILPAKWRITAAIALVMALTVLGTAVGVAGNGGWQSGSVKPGTVIFDGVLVGIGNEAVRVDVTAKALVRLECSNNGGNAAPGRNLIEVATFATGSFPTDENGKAIISLTVADPTIFDIDPSPSPKEAGCPNGKWFISRVIEVFWTRVTVEAIDADGLVTDALFFDCTGVAVGSDCPEVTG